MGLRQYLNLNRSPAEEDSEEIPFGGDSSSLDALEELLGENSVFSLAQAQAGKLRPGMRVQITPGARLPSKEQLQAVMDMSGFNPKEASRIRSEQSGGLRKLQEILNITSTPQLDLSPPAGFAKGIYGIDVGYKPPAPYTDQLAQQAKIWQSIADLETKKIEDAKALAALISKMTTKSPGITLSQAHPPAAGGLRETDIHKDVKDLMKSLPKSAPQIEKVLEELKDEIGSFNPDDNSPLSKSKRLSGGKENVFDRFQDILKYKMGMTDRPLALFDKLIAFQLRDLTGLTATEYEQARAKRIASFTGLGSNAAKRAYIVDTIREIQNDIKTRLAGYSRPGVLETYRKQPGALLPEKFDRFLPEAKPAPTKKSARDLLK